MLTTGSHDHPSKFLQINNQDNKFFSRLLSKESAKGTVGEASFRVHYYGRASGAIPFMWESQPGTPKHPFSETSLPPLTPPPSYQMSPRMNTTQKHSKPKFLQSIFRGSSSSKKSNKSASCSSSSVSSPFSSSYSLPSTPKNPFISRRNVIQRSRSAIHFGLGEDEEEQTANSPTSILCFRGRK